LFFLDDNRFDRGEIESQFGLIYIPPMAEDVEHVSMYLFAIYYSSFEKYLFTTIANVLI
jgi:hypothetical protein